MVHQLRAAVYARVSSDEQVEGYSLDAQRRACSAFVKGHGWTVAREYVEEGRSARTDDIKRRPQFIQMMEDAESHSVDVIVVHKLDRFSRNLRVTLEHFERLGKAGVSFSSITEDMDFSSPWGRLALTLLGGLAQFYSDNLGLEVKKGKAERKAQGLYNGLLPFGSIKGEDGTPVANADTLPGLVAAFELAAQGKSDREVAIALNNAGYRTSGNQGNGPFRKDTARGVLTNRFYLGELPDGNGGWIKGSHEPMIDETLFNDAQKAREANRKVPRTITNAAHTYSLSGLMKCALCGSRMRIHQNRPGGVRAFCSGRAQGGDCNGKGTFLDLYERQIEWYLGEFVIPDDYQQRILEMYSERRTQQQDVHKARAALESRLQRIKDLYAWGDATKEEYQAQRDAIQSELAAIPAQHGKEQTLERLASFLRSVVEGWRAASQKQRNHLAKSLFKEVEVRDRQVVAVRPIPELEPFFRVSYKCQGKSIAGDPDGIRTRDLRLDRSFSIRYECRRTE